VAPANIRTSSRMVLNSGDFGNTSKFGNLLMIGKAAFLSDNPN
jgi:hypothetical protein